MLDLTCKQCKYVLQILIRSATTCSAHVLHSYLGLYSRLADFAPSGIWTVRPVQVYIVCISVVGTTTCIRAYLGTGERHHPVLLGHSVHLSPPHLFTCIMHHALPRVNLDMHSIARRPESRANDIENAVELSIFLSSIIIKNAAAISVNPISFRLPNTPSSS